MHVASTPTVKYTINTWQNTNSHVEETVLPQLQVSHCYVSMLNLPFSNWDKMMEETRGDTGQYLKMSRQHEVW
jgi:hypothetical protein